jgi:hypothetical protein
MPEALVLSRVRAPLAAAGPDDPAASRAGALPAVRR